MRLVLTTDVAGLGAKGDIVQVSGGYGRNFLLPQGLAAKATTGLISQIQEAERARIEALRREVEAAEDLRLQLAETRIVIAANVTDQGRLFGSIGAAEIIDAVKSLSSVVLEPKLIELSEPIKMIGYHEVKINLHPEVQFVLPLDVIPAHRHRSAGSG
ncbi:MAG: 50S ribosomal protein L9 [Acidimicrobiia bacterium]|nr:50S ribosomal protein L9 [bacterium]MCY3653193.1 50S ribosomal protein L9 [bacterium]MXZ06707.1 50S ribosomal protein L9 [Acidimicrobiia bacterium]